MARFARASFLVTESVACRSGLAPLIFDGALGPEIIYLMEGVMDNVNLCRLCGSEPVDPESGSYEMCGPCYWDFESDMDIWWEQWVDGESDGGCLDGSVTDRESDDYPF